MKIMNVLGAFALAALPLTIPATANAQATVQCEAASNYAQGIGIGFNPDSACRRALYECAVRTPAYDRCVIVRWFWS